MMESRLTTEMMEALAQPFPAEAIQWKPGAVTKDGSRALALAYAESRIYQDRLNETVGREWQDDYVAFSVGTKVVVTCRLSVCGVVRCDVGECDSSDPNAVTTAASQAYKRAATKFQIGRFLYALPSRWMPYDSQRRCFTDAALAQLQQAVSSGNGMQSHNGDRYGDGSPLNGNSAERDAYRAYVQAMGKPPENVLALRQWYAANNN